jgi:dolichyl-phosphate beta-glucosyltransferase
MADQNPDISIVVPAFNEERRLPATLERLARYCERTRVAWEIVAVIEKSEDRTAEAAAAVARMHPEISVIVNQVQRGKGYALRTGVHMSSGDVVFTMDADLSVPEEFISVFLEYLAAHPEVDVLAGSRRHPDSVIEVHQTALRRFLGRVFSRLVRLVSASGLSDTQCGFKAFRRRTASEVYSRQTIDGFACDVEILLLAERMGFGVRELPVRWVNSPESKVRLVRDSIGMLWDTLRVRRRVARTLKARPFVAREEVRLGVG